MPRHKMPPKSLAPPKESGGPEKFSLYNMAGWQINNINSLEQLVDEWYLETETNPSALYKSVKLLYRAYVKFRAILNKGDRAYLDKQFKDCIKEAKGLKRIKYITDDYEKLLLKVDDLVLKYFEKKQDVGLNFPVDTSFGGADELKSSIEEA